MTSGLRSHGQAANASTTSIYSGSPLAPGSFVRSSTQTRFTLSGSTAIRYFTENGR